MEEKLLALSEDKNDFGEAIQEWDEVKSVKSVGGTCLCGHQVEHVITILNYKTGKTATFGGDCVKMFFSDSVIDQVKILRKEEMESSKRLCCSCLKLKIDKIDPSYKTFCKSCYNNGEVSPAWKILKYRACKDCEAKEIPPSSASYVKQCPDCYAAYKASMGECEMCGENKVPPESKKSICYSCDKFEEKRKCPQCGLNAIPVADTWRKVCGKCWFKNK